MYCSYFFHTKYIYYEMGNESNRMYQVWKYNIDTKKSILLRQNDNELTSVGISMSNDKKYFFICESSFDSSEYHYFASDQDDHELKLFANMVPGVKYNILHHEGRFLIVTNKDDCRNFKLMETDLTNTKKKAWISRLKWNELSLNVQRRIIKNC